MSEFQHDLSHKGHKSANPAMLAQFQFQQTTVSAYPDSAKLSEYEKLVPGSAKAILDEFVAHSAHQRSEEIKNNEHNRVMDSKQLGHERFALVISSITLLLITFCAIAVALYMIYLQQYMWGALSILATMAIRYFPNWARQAEKKTSQQS